MLGIALQKSTLGGLQARRHVFKSGPADVKASGEGTSAGGESTRGGIPLSEGGSRKFLIYGCLYVRFGPDFQPSWADLEQATLTYP